MIDEKVDKSIVYRKFTEINLIFVFCLALVGSLLSPYLVSIGYEAWQISLMFTVFPFVNVFFMPFFGRIADIFNRRIIIWIGIWLEVFALILYLIPWHWSLIMSARLFDAIAASLVSLIVLAKIEDNISKKQRGTKTGNYLSIGHIGALLGPLVGTFLADRFFIQFPFIVAAMILFILTFFVLTGRYQEIKKVKLYLNDLNWWVEIKQFISHKQLKGMGIMGIVMHATNPALSVFLPLIIVSKMGMSYQSVGIAVFVYGLTHLLQGQFGKISDKLGHYRLVIFGCSMTGLLLLGIYWIESYYWLLVLLFFLGTALAFWNVSAWSLMSDVGESEKIEAQILTSYYSIAKMGALVSYLVSSWLVKQYGLEMIFLVNGVIIILGILSAIKFLSPVNINNK